MTRASPPGTVNFLDIEEQQFVSAVNVPTGKVMLGAEFTKTHEDPKFVANGDLKLYINDDVVAEGTIRTQPGKFALAGEGLAVGRDVADAVSKEYQSPYRFQGGTIGKVTVNISGEPVMDMEMEALGMLVRE